MGPTKYVPDHLTSTRSVAETSGSAGCAGKPLRPDDPSRREAPQVPASGATNSARTPSDCPSCLALRGTSRLLAESALYLIDRNAELTRQLEAYRQRDRRHAELLSGLADLQRAEAGG